MRKTTIGAGVTGVALAAGLAAALLNAGTTSASPAAPAGTTQVLAGSAPAATDGKQLAPEHLDASSVSAVVAASTRATVKVTPKPKPKPKPVAAPKPVRKLTFSLDSGANVGTNVTGFVTLADVLPTSATGVAGVPVVVEQLKGAKYVLITDGVTDESGSMPVNFLAQTSMTLRATTKPATGKAVSSTPFKFSVNALVNWAGRPAMTPTVNVAADYAFRINPASGAQGQLQWALKADKPKWTSAKVVAASAEGVVRQSIKFAKPGTYLVRGASVKSATNGVGTTTTIEVEVSAG